MGSRRRARQFALQALYQLDQTDQLDGEGGAGAAALSGLWQSHVEGEGVEEGPPPTSAEVEFAQRLVAGVRHHQREIDALIEECSTNWRLRRMAIIDRNILRMGTFELMQLQDVPGSVSVNEAVELAKRYGTRASRAFVNGLVDRIGRQLGRLPARGRRS